MPVPYLDLKRDIAAHRAGYLEATARVLDSGIFTLGPETKQFEDAFGRFLGVPFVVGVNGGTQALYASFLALGIGPGDEVILPTNSFVATAEAVVMAGAIPVMCDVNERTLCLDVARARAAITEKTKAIVPVHLHGFMDDMTPIMELAAERGLAVIEDAAQAHGAERNGRRAGTLGRFGCFSFYPTKNLGALGEAGAVVTADQSLAEELRAIRCHGIKKEKYVHERFGTNLKMHALQAACLSLKLVRLEAANQRRRDIARLYREAFSALPLALPPAFDATHVFHVFAVRTERRDALRDFLHVRGIETSIHYPTPIHLQPAFRRYGRGSGACPVAESAAGQLLSLPLFPEMRADEIDEVIRTVQQFFA